VIVCDGCRESCNDRFYVGYCQIYNNLEKSATSLDVCKKCAHLAERYMARTTLDLAKFLKRASKWSPEDADVWFSRKNEFEL
jgi:hypothetical protein